MGSNANVGNMEVECWRHMYILCILCHLNTSEGSCVVGEVHLGTKMVVWGR